jgi:hypothetical protein
MAPIPFSDREMEKSWNTNRTAYHQATSRTNAHRLLLFYAVECGLKAIFMKGTVGVGGTSTDSHPEIIRYGHDINKLLDSLQAGGNLNLPNILFIEDIQDNGCRKERKLNNDKINEMWRYGGKVLSITQKEEKATDEDIEKKLLAIEEWIIGELEKL